MQTDYLCGLKNYFIALTGFFLLHQTGDINDLQANDVSINIESVNILLSGGVSIRYSLDGEDAEQVDEIYIIYLPVLGGEDQHTFIKEPTVSQTLSIPRDEFEFPIDSQSLNFVLWAFIDGVFQDASIIHSSIFLKSIESTAKDCDLAIYLEWMNYASYPPNWEFPLPPLFPRVEVMVYEYDEDDGLCSYLSTVGSYTSMLWDQDVVTNFNYDPGKYCFRLTAIRGNKTATSNTIITEIDDYNVPEIVLIRSVDVNLDNQTVEINAEVDDFGFNEFLYRLYRSDNPYDSNAFVEIERIDSHSNRNIRFVDKPDLKTNPWYYYIEADIIDCQNQGYERVSETVPSIFLEYDFESVTQNDITIRFGWEYDVFFDNYDSFQVITDRGDNYVINNFATEELQISVDVDQLGTSFNAWIQALQDETPVHSNAVHVRIQILDEDNIPNAIRPSSQIPDNQKFLLPFIIEPNNYYIRIYDRNGMMVFDYDGDYDPDQSAWDGKIKNKGNLAPEGAYIYHLEYITPGNNHLETHKGVVYLVW